MIILFDDGYAGFYFLKKNFTKFHGKITKSLPKKKTGMISSYNEKVLKFDKKIWTYIVNTFDMGNMKVMVIAGPGNAKNRFMDRLKDITMYDKNQEVRDKVKSNFSKFLKFSTSTIFKSSINEILDDPKA